MNKSDKIYVTGHTGMVGKNMLDLLRQSGYKNIVTVSAKIVDLLDQSSVDKFFAKEKPEYVFHFAAKVGGIMANINNPASFLYENLMITSNVIHASYKNKVKKLLYLGSSCVYPRESKQPMKKEYLLTGPLEPTNEGYAIAKIAGLKLCEYYNKQYKTNFLALMPSNLYGRYEHFDKTNSHVLSALIMKFHEAKEKNKKDVTLWGTGSAKREFLYVEDLVEACLFFMKEIDPTRLGNTFVNIGYGEDISIKNLAKQIAAIVGYKGEIKWDTSKPDGMPRKLLDVTEMRKLGFTPKIDLETGIRKTYEYYLQRINK